ncbi:MAG: hypothetical protein ABSB61_09220 [Anaerolineales bacterium]
MPLNEVGQGYRCPGWHRLGKWAPRGETRKRQGVRALIVPSMVLLAGIVACGGDPVLAIIAFAVWAFAVWEGGW